MSLAYFLVGAFLIISFGILPIAYVVIAFNAKLLKKSLTSYNKSIGVKTQITKETIKTQRILSVLVLLLTMVFWYQAIFL